MKALKDIKKLRCHTNISDMFNILDIANILCCSVNENLLNAK